MKNLALCSALVACFAAAPVMAGASSEAQVYAAVQNKEWTKAEGLLREGLKQTPNDAQQLLNLAYVLQSAGRKGEASEIYGKVLAMDSNPIVTMDSDEKLKAKILAKRRMTAMAAQP